MLMLRAAGRGNRGAWAVTGAAVLGWAATGAAAGADLPVGIPVEPTFVTTVLRTLVVLWSLALLAYGFKMGRAVVATFLGIAGLAVGMFTVGGSSILLAAAIAWLVVALGVGLYLRFPRLVMAVAMFWPLPILLIAHLYFSGSFDRNRPLLIALLVTGVALGAVFPRRSLVLLSAAMGTALFLLAGPLSASFGTLVLIAASAVAWQASGLGAWRPHPRDPRLAGLPHTPCRKESWLGVMRWTAVILAGGLILITLLVPAYDSGSVPDPGRLERLAGNGKLSRPGLVLGALNNFYLSGRPVALAVASDTGGPFAKLSFGLTGRVLTGDVFEARSVKEEGELEEMRRAAAITSRAFEDIHEVIRPGLNEADIQQLILDFFARNGATGVAFPCIVGSGDNAVLPHYMNNDADMTEGLVVIDIGSSVNGYTSDMTRTFSVTGNYSEAQRRLIETVIESGDSAREALGPGVRLKEVDTASRRVIEDAGFGPYYTHSVGHHLGLDVHDPGGDPLEAGMVVTIEPGIYVPEGADVDPEYWNLGVRIEDSYIVTEEGWEEITSYPRRPYALDLSTTVGEPQKQRASGPWQSPGP